MSYFLDLFSPETYEAFSRSDRGVSGFRQRHRGIAARVKPGDKLVCYMTKVMRWIGMLEVLDGPYEDATPLHSQDNDPYTVRFHVKPVVWLPVEKGIPIHEDRVWDSLSFTRDHNKGSSTWTGKLRGSLVQFSDADGSFIESLVSSQASDGKTYPIDTDEYRRLAGHRVRRADKDVLVVVPEDRDTSRDAIAAPPEEVRESIKIQALLAEIGSRMGMQIFGQHEPRVTSPRRSDARTLSIRSRRSRALSARTRPY